MKNIKIAALSLVVLVCLVTLFIQIPLPSRGYLNVGDVAVVFGGMILGLMDSRKGAFWALAVTGIGSALADVFGGFAVFAPITLVAKGCEGLLAALAASRSGLASYILLGLGGLSMVGVYFVGESLMPSIGLQGAVGEILPNLFQAAVGVFAGSLAAKAFQRTGLL